VIITKLIKKFSGSKDSRDSKRYLKYMCHRNRFCYISTTHPGHSGFESRYRRDVFLQKTPRPKLRPIQPPI